MWSPNSTRPTYTSMLDDAIQRAWMCLHSLQSYFLRFVEQPLPCKRRPFWLNDTCQQFIGQMYTGNEIT